MDNATTIIKSQSLLKHALGQLVRIEPKHTLSLSDVNPGLQHIVTAQNEKRLHPWGIHAHVYPELCMALTGGATLQRDEQCYNFCPPAMALFPPSVSHCEGWMGDAHHPHYQLLWMSFSGSAVMAIVSRYRRGKRWDIPHRWVIQHNAGTEIYRHMTQHEGINTTTFELIRAEVLILLAALFKQQVQSVHDSPQDSRSQHESLLRQVRMFIDHHFDEPISINGLASSFGLTPNYLNHLYRRWSGETIHAHVTRKRMETAWRLLGGREPLLVKQVATRLGYSDVLYFSRAFHRFHGVTPTQARDIEEGRHRPSMDGPRR